VPLGNRHYAAVDEAKVEVGVAVLELVCTSHQASGEVGYLALAADSRAEKGSGGAGAHTAPGQVIHLDQDRRRDDCVTSQPGDQRCSNVVRAVPSVYCGNQRTGVNQDFDRRVPRSAPMA
jgi:hypothetical protein